MSGDDVKCEFLEDGRIVLATLDRDDCRNAMTESLLGGLSAALRRAHSAGARVLVLAANGNTFCAGADLTAMRRIQDPDERRRLLPQHIEKMSLRTREALRLLRLPRLVTVAAVDGNAIGGGFLLALCCDFRFAAPQASFWFPEIGHGRAGYMAALRIITAHAGPAVAKEMLLTERRYGAAEMLAMRLVNGVSDGPSSVGDALRLAGRLAGYEPGALTAMKAMIDTAASGPLEWDGRAPAVDADGILRFT